jgi:hypothetical protein
MKLNEAIINIRVELQNAKLKQSGKNTFAGFTYFELSDFLPKLNELMLKYKVNDHIIICKESAELTLLLGEERQTYTIPFTVYETPKNKNGFDSMQHIQYLGALNTYYKRYLYLNAFGITDGEVIDAMEQPQQKQQPSQQNAQKITIDKVIELADVKGIATVKICEAYKIETLQHATSQELNTIYNQLLKK